tara:strand:- start:1 stop:609 length:609 start_codon:yes stop_codon:yes gene_type:complete
MIKLFHATGSRSVRIIWLFEELGLDYDLVQLERGKNNPDFAEASPFAKIPAIKDGDLLLSESVAIVQYILLKYGEGRLQPEGDSKQYAHFLHWLNFGESTLILPIVEILKNTMFRPEEYRHPYTVESAKESFVKLLKTMDPMLSQQDFLVGNEFTAADIINGYTLRLANNLELLNGAEGTKNVCDYYKRLEEREAFQKAITS